MKKLIALFSLVFSSFVLASSLNTMVMFGDSLSDNGNLYKYVQRKLPPSPYYEGRFTNGLVWVEQLAESYFPKNTSSHLIDYAFGGASASGRSPLGNKLKEAPLITLKRQIDAYLLPRQGQADPQSLFIVWIGANDYLALPSNTEQALQEVNQEITKELQRLAKVGAKSILVLNLPDLGKMPAAREFGLQTKLSYLAKRHNETLANAMTSLKQDYPEVQWLYYDVNHDVEDIFLTPKQYGFTNITGTCYETIQKNKNCEGYLFFDLVHSTAAAHQIMAEKAHHFLEKAGIEFISSTIPY